MEIVLISVVKLVTIFFGGGLAALFACWIANEVNSLAKNILSNELNEQKTLNLDKTERISAQSGLYEIFLPEGKTIKLFSSHKGMELV